MKYQTLIKAGVLAVGLTIFTACGSSQSQNKREQGQRERGGRMPSVSQLIAEMDSNKDGKLSKSEVKGPLANDFSKIDSNNDGFISKEELENAPKPERGGGQRGGQRR